MILAGLGMLVGNVMGGKLADTFPTINACIISLSSIVICLFLDYLVVFSQPLTLLMTFVTGAVTFTLSARIQILMIRTAGDAEMLGAFLGRTTH